MLPLLRLLTLSAGVILRAVCPRFGTALQVMVAHILEQSCVDSMRSLPAISLSMFNLGEDSLSRLEMHLSLLRGWS